MLLSEFIHYLSTSTVSLPKTTHITMFMIHQQDVKKHQESWTNMLLDLSKCCQDITNNQAHRMSSASLKLHAQNKLSQLYHSDKILFKPTLAKAPHNIRTTFEDLVNYFIDNESDAGFAWKAWKGVHFTQSSHYCNELYAVSMGTYNFIQQDESITTAEFTFVYNIDPHPSENQHNHSLKIIAHHSSLPYDS